MLVKWILQNKAEHFIVLTQCSVLNRDSPDGDVDRREQKPIC